MQIISNAPTVIYAADDNALMLVLMIDARDMLMLMYVDAAEARAARGVCAEVWCLGWRSKPQRL
jgi:hypothetical protein